jgi:hypothetical protein
LSRAEFARLRILELPELFADLDANGDHSVSLDEWAGGSPDQSGIPRGSRPPVGTAPPTYPSLVPHGRNVPRIAPTKVDRLPEHAPLTGHGGTPGRNRFFSPRLPPQPPQMPPSGMPPPN